MQLILLREFEPFLILDFIVHKAVFYYYKNRTLREVCTFQGVS